jgi:DUF917 family protein
VNHTDDERSTMSMRTIPLTRRDLEDILLGATLLGSGGGGPRVVGQQILESLVKRGTLPTLIGVGDLEDDAWGAVSAFAGSPDGAASGSFDWSPATEAFKDMIAWGEANRRPMAFVLPVELGGGNSFIPLAVAASLSPALPVVDCAGARRAVPGLPELSYAAPPGVPVSPMVLASPTDRMRVEVTGARLADDVLRSVVVSSGFGEEAGVALWPMNGATVKTAAVVGATTYAQKLGAALREAPTGGAVAAALRYTGGVLLAQGTITKVTASTAGGFDLTTIVVRTDQGDVRVFAQNENLIAYRSTSPTPLAMAPDLLGWLTPGGVPFSNADPEMEVGTEVSLLGMPAPAAMRAPYFVQQFLDDLRTAGYGGSYVALEHLPR